MPRIVLKLNQTIETPDPMIEIDVGLEPGRHRFQLEVFDEAGNRSLPAVTIVEVQRAIVEPRPTGPLVDPVRPPVDLPVRPVVGPVVGPLDAPNLPRERASPAPTAAPRAAPRRRARRPRKKE